jgi:hypothetical protein
MPETADTAKGYLRIDSGFLYSEARAGKVLPHRWIQEAILEVSH